MQTLVGLDSSAIADMAIQIDPSAFASDDSVKLMLKDMEEQFAARFCKYSHWPSIIVAIEQVSLQPEATTRRQ
jgi:hypothetical protein